MCSRSTAATDFDFLERMFHKLLLNFTWWVNRKDADGNNVFAGGFLGLDNIGPIDRSAPLPIDGALEQSDGTSWMAMYCLDLLEMSLTLARHDRVYEDVATKFFEHFALIAEAMYSRGLWDDEDGFYYDVLALTDGERIPLKVRSMVGLLPLAATTTLGRDTLDKLPEFTARTDWFMEHRPDYSDLFHMHARDGGEGRLLSIVSPDRLRRVLRWLLDENEFLSPHGVRALSAAYRERSVLRRPRRDGVHRRLRPGRIDDRIVRRQLQLARPGLVPGELHRDRSHPPVRPILRRRLPSSSTRPVRARS